MDQILTPSTNNSYVDLHPSETTDTHVPSDFPLESDTEWLEWLNTIDWTNNNWADLERDLATSSQT